MERKQSPDVSCAFWIPTIWILVSASKPMAIWFNMGGSDMEAGSPLDRAFQMGLGCLALIIIAKRHSYWSILIKDNIWVAILISYMLISISWSDIPFISFKRWTREIIAVIIAFFIATEKDPYQAFQSIFRRLIYITMPFSLILIKYYPDLGVFYSRDGFRAWNGVALHKNGLTNLCTFFIFFLIWTFIRRWNGRDKIVVWYQTYIEIFIILLTIYLFMGPNHTPTYSATSMISLTIALIALIWFFRMQRNEKIIRVITLILIVGFIIYGTIIPFIGQLKIIDISSAVGRDQSLTGRVDTWAKVIPYVWDKPFWGCGYGAFLTDSMIETIGAYHVHNGYLDIILNIGFIGLGFFSMFLFKNCRNAQREMTKNFDWGVLWLGFLLITALSNMAEPSGSSFRQINMFLLLFLSFAAAAVSVNTKIYEDHVN